jgi:hypothetical protein
MHVKLTPFTAQLARIGTIQPAAAGEFSLPEYHAQPL